MVVGFFPSPYQCITSCLFCQIISVASTVIFCPFTNSVRWPRPCSGSRFWN